MGIAAQIQSAVAYERASATCMTCHNRPCSCKPALPSLATSASAVAVAHSSLFVKDAICSLPSGTWAHGGAGDGAAAESRGARGRVGCTSGKKKTTIDYLATS